MTAAGRVAVVTGASRGIGYAIARALLDAGASVCLCARGSDELEQARRSLSSDRICAVTADVSNPSDVERLFSRCREALGPVDWVVNNAGVSEDPTAMEALEPAVWNAVLATNVTGAFLCTRAAAEDLKARRGRVVNVSSMAGQGALPGFSAYTASKWALNGLTVTLAEEWRSAGVLVAAVLPSAVDTRMLRRAGFTPQRSPEEVAKVVRQLLVEAPFSATGSLVEVA